MTEKKKSWKEYLDTGLMITIVVAVGGFWANWHMDEAEEEIQANDNKQLMFDSPEDKVKNDIHLETVDDVDLKVQAIENVNFQKMVLEKFEEDEKWKKTQDSLSRLNVRLSSEARNAH